MRDQQRWIFWRLSAFIPALGFLSQVNLIVLLAYGGALVIRGELPLGAGLVVFAGLLQQFSGQVLKISDIANSVQTSLTGARRVFEVLDTPVEITNADPGGLVRLPRAKGEVCFEGVHFDYVSEHSVLRGVDFKVAPGHVRGAPRADRRGQERVAEPDPAFLRSERGTRTHRRPRPPARIDLDDLRRNIGLVFQESFLFSNTVAANIAFGQPGATIQQIERAAELAQAHDFITHLPDGYQTVLGEGASNLSGGQRQRLAIARALLLEPAILVLDDPTAAVDPGTEHEILSALDGAMAGRTTFLVAHRVSTLRRADLVMVLDGGRIVEFGPPAELLRRQGGHYQRVAELQVADAREPPSARPRVTRLAFCRAGSYLACLSPFPTFHDQTLSVRAFCRCRVAGPRHRAGLRPADRPESPRAETRRVSVT